MLWSDEGIVDELQRHTGHGREDKNFQGTNHLTRTQGLPEEPYLSAHRFLAPVLISLLLSPSPPSASTRKQKQTEPRLGRDEEFWVL